MVFVAHQIALSLFGLQNYVLYAPRSSLISANKGGIISLSGLWHRNNCFVRCVLTFLHRIHGHSSAGAFDWHFNSSADSFILPARSASLREEES
jgi:hypothetical protein